MRPADGPLQRSPVPRPKLAEQVAQQLLDEIRASNLAPGDRIPSERQLTLQLGVGRSTVREALNDLALTGAIEIRHGQGAFVAGEPRARPSALARAVAKGLTRDVLEVWSLVEVQAAELAAERRTPDDLQRLDAVLTEHRRALYDGRRAAEAAARFHVQLAAATHNEVLASFARSVHDLLLEGAPPAGERDGYEAWELAEHRTLNDAVRVGSRAAAGAAMRAHVTATLERLASLDRPLPAAAPS